MAELRENVWTIRSIFTLDHPHSGTKKVVLGLDIRKPKGS